MPEAQSRDWRDEIRRRLIGVGLAPEREAEVVEELSQHLEDRYRELCLGGADEDRAIRDALDQLDESDLVHAFASVERGDVRDPLPLGGGHTSGERPGSFAGFWHDVRFGARLLGKDKGVTVVIVITLALAIAVNAIVFGLTDLLLLRPLPFANATRVAAIYAADERSTTSRDPLSIPQYRDLVRETAVFESVTAMMGRQFSLTGAGEPQAIGALLATANVFSTLGLDMVKGRAFLPGEDEAGRSNVAVLSHHFWTGRFHGDPDILGRTLIVNGIAHTVIGVVTPAIEVGTLSQVDVWLPLETRAAMSRQRDRDLAVYGLLEPGQTIETANAELAALTGRLRREYPVTDGHLQIRAISMRDSNTSPDTPLLLGSAGIVVGLVLLLACANVGTVMQARATARQREIALRLALGATRTRLIRQLISEGALLGLLSGAVGVLLAAAIVPGLRLLTPDRYVQTLAINLNVLLFTLVLSIAAPVLFGLLPALHASRPDLNADLKEGARVGPSRRLHQKRSALVVTQVAFALTVLIISGLVVRSAFARQHVPIGLASSDVLCVRVRFDPPKYTSDEGRIRTIEAVLDRMAATPGIDAAAAGARVPIVDQEPQRQFMIVGRAAPSEVPWAVEATMTPGLRETVKLSLLDGRLFTADDRQSTARVAIVSREAVRRYWPGQSPLGQRLVLLNGAGEPANDAISVVGVVDDVKGVSLIEAAPPRIYFPLSQRVGESAVFLVRTSRDTALMAGLMRDALRAEDADLALSEIRSLNQMLATRLFRPFDLVLALFAGFAGIALLLALTGVYGVAAFSIGQRRHEIGIRLALGATSAEVTRLVVLRSFRPIAAGLAIGTVGGWALASLMRGLLYGTQALDPSTYITVTGLLAFGGLIASLVPARRAAGGEPVFVLKQQ
ncbi:MAG TPA: ABC transporter permease [Vicinamibacterales bacterium]|jgi:putative ABC transport system permease protein